MILLSFVNGVNCIADVYSDNNQFYEAHVLLDTISINIW